jgi:hypothetical protein
MVGVFNTNAQHSVHPTGGSRRVFRQFAWFEVGPIKVVLSRPAHPRVTQAVRRFYLDTIVLYLYNFRNDLYTFSNS